ncbi:hypothetical protein ACFL6U_32550 [Planctomycetota bacterium]
MGTERNVIPCKKFTCGPINAAIWENDRTVNNEIIKTHSISIAKTYKDGGEWKNTNYLNPEDLPKVALVAQEVYRYLKLKITETN